MPIKEIQEHSILKIIEKYQGLPKYDAAHTSIIIRSNSFVGTITEKRMHECIHVSYALFMSTGCLCFVPFSSLHYHH